MNLKKLFYSQSMIPFYKLEVGEYFSVEHPVTSNSDIMLKTVNDDSIYIGHSLKYFIYPSRLVTHVNKDTL